MRGFDGAAWGSRDFFFEWAATWRALDPSESLRDIHDKHFDSFIRLLQVFVNSFVNSLVNRRENEERSLIKFFYSFK
ncbi:hypothetical protein RW25_05425 [Bacillus sp. L_1B0_8]|nr:hypothetical protein RT27_06390 [Bacillus sp. L_1B0_5]KIQ91399.1 hypothetical protein RW25_05425 [Bacillus sp. L_1B0_8]